MENTAIVLKSVQPTFKTKELNTATTAIYQAINRLNATAAETHKTVAVIFARVERKQTYKAEGFKSLEEYAEQIGIAKSKAHKLKDAGRLLDSKDETVRNFANNTDYSKLAILSSAGEDAVKAAVESGALKPEQTQDDVRAWKNAHNAASDKPKVVPTWHIVGKHVFGTSVKAIDETVGIANPKDWAREYDDTMECAVVSFGKAGNKVYLATNDDGGEILRYTAAKVEKPKAKTPKAKTLDPKALTDEQLAAMIAEYNARRKAETGE